MAQKTAAVIGATGLIGSHLVELLKEDNGYETIRLLVRRPITITHEKIEMKLVNFEDYESVKLAIDGCEAVFCAVGTTQKKVKGDKVAYRKVDYDIPVTAARACYETHSSNFVLISSVGASAESNNFYLKLKGLVENTVKNIQINSVAILRPSMLLGNRKEQRLGESIAQPLIKIIAPLLQGKLSKYKPIAATDVAIAMVKAAGKNKKGYHVYEYNQLMELISQ